METEELIMPLFAYPPVGPRLKIADIAHDIAAAGVPSNLARSRVAVLARDRHIHVRANGPHTAPNLFEVSDSAAAIVLSALLDCGISDKEVMRAASMALYCWSEKAKFRDRIYQAADQKHLPRHPIDRAIYGIAKSESWSLVLNIWRDTQSGERIVDGDLHRCDTPFVGHRDIPITATPRGAFVNVLDEAVLPVIRRLVPVKVN